MLGASVMVELGDCDVWGLEAGELVRVVAPQLDDVVQGTAVAVDDALLLHDHLKLRPREPSRKVAEPHLPAAS